MLPLLRCQYTLRCARGIAQPASPHEAELYREGRLHIKNVRRIKG